MTRDPLDDAFLRLRAAVDADEHDPVEQVIEVVLDRLAHAEDVQTGDDAASRVAERVMREVRKEFEAVLEAREAEHRRQMANKEKRHAEEKQHLRDQLHDARAEIRHLHDQLHDTIEEGVRKHGALRDIREWAKPEHVLRFDDGDVPLADYITNAIGKTKDVQRLVAVLVNAPKEKP